ncbi:MAG: hypothetical protein E7052_11115 [Lentisphaerae bacterium]|nr:hypothetical protein [Lentisphaerota bacterium]
MSKVPISLIIDDGGVVNTYFFHDLRHKHELLIPPAFAILFGKICAQYGVRGKYSVVPIPCGLGRLDEPENVNMVPSGNIEAFIKYAKEYIAPRFSITPELLTHLLAWDLQRGGKVHYCEDTYISRLNAAEIADYISLGLQILDKIGLTPSGASSPWRTGIDNEEEYAKGIGMAFKRTLNRDRTFYFLHSMDHIKRPRVMCDSPETGKVVNIPNRTIDPFWGGHNPNTNAEAIALIRRGIDTLLSEDGKSGLLRENYEEGNPLVMLTHWTSLYSDGRALGLEGFEHLLQRINKVFGNQVEWVNFEELASMY